MNMARQYHLAARTLRPLEPQAHAPVYFLFTHTIELALKAYLRSRDVAIQHGQPGHALRDLLSQCRENGLPISLDLQNVVQLLESENRQHGFRYFLFESTFVPEISFLSEVVDVLMREIDEKVREVEEDVINQPTTDRPRIVLKSIVGKPTSITADRRRP